MNKPKSSGSEYLSKLNKYPLLLLSSNINSYYNLPDDIGVYGGSTVTIILL